MKKLEVVRSCSVKKVFLEISQNPMNFAKFTSTPFFYRTPLVAAYEDVIFDCL